MPNERASKPDVFKDELDTEIAESMKDPEYRAASEDADARVRLIETLVTARRLAGLTQKDVAERMGVRQPTVSEFEAALSDPRMATVYRYARVCGVRVVALVTLDPDDESDKKEIQDA